MGSLISKIICKKKYRFYDKFYDKTQALLKAAEIRNEGKIRWKTHIKTYIEEVEEFGDVDELFIPTKRFYLWTREKSKTENEVKNENK